MKRFHFPLGRVLDWRRTQVRIEEAKLERAHAEVRRIQGEIEAVRTRQAEAARALLQDGSATGIELAAFSGFTRLAAEERARLSAAAEAARQRARRQAEAVVQSRQKVRPLEKLEDRQRAAWNIAFARQSDLDAEEAHLARLAALRREPES